jgi:hypothetical protein
MAVTCLNIFTSPLAQPLLHNSQEMAFKRATVHPVASVVVVRVSAVSALLDAGAPRHDPAGRDSSGSSKQPVSPAECCRPSSTFPGSSWSPTSCQYYAIGNTAGFNVAAGAPPDQQQIRVLLAGCGDIRNLLATVAGLEDSVTPEVSTTAAAGSCNCSRQQQRQLQFVLNDGNISMLARNAVMLHMIVEQQVPPERQC